MGARTIRRYAKGGLTAANCTVSVWEGFQATVDNIVEFNRHLTEHADLIRPVQTTKDIFTAKEEGKTGLSSAFKMSMPSKTRLVM